MTSVRPHPFTLRQLQYALAVASQGSFHAAAKACGVSQPALSAQVAQLEDALGVVLFERDRRGVRVTPGGKALLDRMDRLVGDGHALAEAARRASDPLRGTLRVGVIPTIAPYLLPALSARVRAALPELALLWTEEKTPALAAALQDGSLDAALLAREADLGDVESAAVADDPFVLAAPAGHPAVTAPGPVSLEALGGEPVLLLDDGHCFRDQALSVCARAGLREREYRATSLPTLVQMVAGGAGLTLLPAMAVETEAPRARLAVRPLAAPAPGRTVVLAWRARSPLADALRRLAVVMGGLP